MAAAEDEAQERLFEIVRAGPCPQVGRRVVSDEVSPAEEEEPIASGGLVHDVARHDQCRTRVGKIVESLPQVGAQHRVEPDGGFVEDENLW